MYKPDDFQTALPLVILSLVCWGSWANVNKFSTLPFPFFYAYYALSLLASTTLFGLILGNETLFPSHQGDKEDFIGNILHIADWEHIWLGLASGTVFNAANVLLVIGIELVGLSIAFPIGIGLSLVMGTVLTWLIEPASTDATLLFVGVLLAFTAVCCMALSYHFKGAAEAEEGSSGDPAKYEAMGDIEGDAGSRLARASVFTFQQLLGLLVLCGVLMGSWAPLAQAAMEGANGLNSYTQAFFFTVASAVTSIPAVLFLMKNSFDGSGPVTWTDASGHGWSALWAVFGGFIWTSGTVINLVSSSQVSLAVSYSIGQSAPMVAACWGIFVWREFDGAPRASWVLLGLMFAFYFAAISCIAVSSAGAGPGKATNETVY